LPEGRRGHVAAFGGASGAEYRGTPTKLAGKYTSLGSSRCPRGHGGLLKTKGEQISGTRGFIWEFFTWGLEVIVLGQDFFGQKTI